LKLAVLATHGESVRGSEATLVANCSSDAEKKLCVEDSQSVGNRRKCSDSLSASCIALQ